jgi:hypothetical protein
MAFPSPKARLTIPDPASYGIGIIVIGLCHARNNGVERIAVLLSDQLLDQHRHGPLFNPDIRIFCISLGRLEEGRGINQLYRIRKMLQANLRVLVPVWQDICLENPGKGEDLRILQNAGGTDRRG